MTGSTTSSAKPTRQLTPELLNSSPNSDDSGATTNEQFSLPQAEVLTSDARQSPNSIDLNSIRYEQRIFVVGATRTGKSTLTKRLFQSAAAPRLVVDPGDTSLTASVVSPGGTFSDPRRVPDVATARYVPRDPDDRDAYDVLFRWAFEHYPRYVWLDEAGQVAPASGYSKALNRYVVQGAKRGLGLISCHTRPREVMRNLIAQSAHVFVFDLPNPDDRKHVADIVGLPVVDLESALSQLEQKGFLWWNGDERELTICPPLKGV